MNHRYVLKEWRQPLVAEEQPIPAAPPGGAVVRILYAGLCHSDVHIWQETKDPTIKTPLVLGHEISGVVHELGPGVPGTTPSVGSQVIVHPWEFCGRCDHCKAGSIQCTAPPKEHRTQGVYVDGGFQNYVVAYNAEQLIPVPQGMRLDVGAISACSGVTAYNAVTSLRSAMDEAFRITGRATVLLVGVGGLCLWAISIIRAFWPRATICVVDILKEKVDDGLKAGADLGVVWELKEGSAARASKVATTLGTNNADAAVDFTGHTDSVSPIFRSLNKAATYASVGMYNGKMSLPTALVAQNSVRVQGIYVGNRAQLRELLQLLAAGKVTSPPITHIRCEAITETLVKLREGKQKGRAVVRYEQPNKL